MDGKLVLQGRGVVDSGAQGSCGKTMAGRTHRRDGGSEGRRDGGTADWQWGSGEEMKGRSDRGARVRPRDDAGVMWAWPLRFAAVGRLHVRDRRHGAGVGG